VVVGNILYATFHIALRPVFFLDHNLIGGEKVIERKPT